MNSLTDQELLRDYSERRTEPAFAELVRRHVNLVYSAALRMVHDAHLAEDVTQRVFAALAQNARQLVDRPVLSGWLHRTAQNLAAKTVRTEVRRRAREQEAATMNELVSSDSQAVWEQIAPHLDAALVELNEADRDAVLLRYFERKSALEMAETLGISSEAAQKRVSRAVERLREFLAKRGVTAGAGGLVVVISANATQAAPTGLALAISASAVAGTTIAATATATKTIAMTTLQKTIITAVIAASLGTGIYEARRTSELQSQVQTLQREQAEQVRQLVHERDHATNQLASLSDEIARLKRNNTELLKLRSEAGMLRKQNQSLAQERTSSTNANAAKILGKGFGNLGEYLPAEKVSDAGNGTPEALLQTLVWAIREGKVERLEQIGAPFGGQSKPGDEAGKISESEAAMFKMVQDAFNNSAGFRLSSQMSDSGQKYDVRLDAEPLEGNRLSESLRDFHLSFVLEHKTNGWWFGNPSADSASK